MQNKIVKISAGIVVGLLSLSTTVFAGYKVIQSKDVKVLGVTNSPVSTQTPEVIEQIEEVEEVAVINTNKPTPRTTSLPTAKSSPVGFNDIEDDEVEFEDHDEDDKNEDSEN